MAFLSPELSAGELTLLLSAMVFALIPLTIRALCIAEQRRKPSVCIGSER